MRFRFEARDGNGVRQRGTLEASAALQARQALRARGWSIVSIRPVRFYLPPGLATTNPLGGGRLSIATRQLATLLRAGMPLTEVLQAVSSQSERADVRQVLRAVGERVAEGFTLAQALEEHPQAFPPVYRATVAAAERSGYLPEVFERLADHAERQQALRQKVKLALVYPAILLMVSILVVGFLLGYVVPDVVQAFARGHAQLPFATRLLMVMSDFTARFGWLALMVGALAVMLACWALRQPARRQRWDEFALRLPLWSAFVRASDAARFVATLATLGRSGVALVEAMHIAAAVTSNLALRERLACAAREVAEGTSLASSLTRSAALPVLTLHMIASGERAGELDTMLERAADLQEKHLASRIALLVSLCEPVMLLTMGGIVLFIVLAILMPILNLNQLVT
ncbi:type II secretion system inner membrane protein GspF [Pseudomonas sp. PSKL.D1]|uniref:type II secretion system inner membrane protein GspF n=1 Tax=Pseudomonas sp. PSKL.D1 TaxID=3029060 RepID=UPI0023814D0D|nr:type II secretion system inner membrane protein GspF [Pseudomonas sp. PSKL.D1]WDY58358.1 type II secretion system inner membrane protein GspF [Pseudomonas sp. PSKL.D1]